jgi:hypothetical protein
LDQYNDSPNISRSRIMIILRHRIGVATVLSHNYLGDMDRMYTSAIDIQSDQSIQIDYIRLFTVPEPTFLPILSLILLPAFLRRGPRFK